MAVGDYSPPYDLMKPAPTSMCISRGCWHLLPSPTHETASPIGGHWCAYWQSMVTCSLSLSFMMEQGTLATYLGCSHICSHPTSLIGALLHSFVPDHSRWHGPTIARACQHMPEPTRVHPPWLLCPLLSMLLVAGMHILVVVNITDSDLLTFVLTIFNLHCEVVSKNNWIVSIQCVW